MSRPCLDCGDLTTRRRCRPCQIRWDAHRNAQEGRKAYRRPEYLSQPKTGVCWLCGLPGADTRDHVVPLAVDSRSTLTRPAHRACNSARRDRQAPSLSAKVGI